MAVRAVQTSIGGRFVADAALFGDGKTGRHHIHRGQGVGSCRLCGTTIVTPATRTPVKLRLPHGVHGQPLRVLIIN
jgi:hypothetical protein